MVKVDRSTMAHSLECRNPLLDHKVVEFAATLPQSFKLRGGTKKYILKETYKNRFPAGFFDRKKQGFSVPLASWFRTSLKNYVYDTLKSSQLRNLGALNIDALTGIVDEHMRGTRDHQEIIWNCLVLSEWLAQQTPNN